MVFNKIIIFKKKKIILDVLATKVWISVILSSFSGFFIVKYAHGDFTC